MKNPQLRQEVTSLHANLCAALADPSRILLLYALAEGPHNVSELTDLLDVSQPTVSRHLKVLRERGLVESARDGQNIYYRLKDLRIIEALDLLRGLLSDILTQKADLVRER